ncbi:MAG: hypothetical protein ACRCS8_05180 [Brevinema sp.]
MNNINRIVNISDFLMVHFTIFKTPINLHAWFLSAFCILVY